MAEEHLRPYYPQCHPPPPQYNLPPPQHQPHQMPQEKVSYRPMPMSEEDPPHHPFPQYHHPPPPQYNLPPPQPEPETPQEKESYPPHPMAEAEEPPHHPYPQYHPPPPQNGHPPPQPEPQTPKGKRHPKPMAPAPPPGGGGGGGRSILCSFLVFFLLLAGITAMTVYFVYHPRKPRFSVAGAAIYDLNTTCFPFISSSMQFTILARNPNKRVTIYYDKLSAYVSYRDQQITPSMDLPPLVHRKKSTVALSPVLGGFGVPVSAEVVNGLAVDEAYGVVAFRVVLVGRLRWKAGAIKTVKYGFGVKCDVWVGLKKGFSGLAPLLESPSCRVDVN